MQYGESKALRNCEESSSPPQLSDNWFEAMKGVISGLKSLISHCVNVVQTDLELLLTSLTSLTY